MNGNTNGNTNGRPVLISGAGIAGPALAYWLRRAGYRVTVVEQAAALREGGGAVDFRGAQLAVLERMGVLDAVRARQTGMGAQTVIDAQGQPIVALPSHVFSGEVEIARGDLTRIVYERTRDDVEYVFGDTITGLTETAAGVEVTFRHGAGRTFDLVVGADGLHSVVRGLVFGDESRFRADSGFAIAGFTAPNQFGLDHAGLIYNEPGRGVLLGSARDSSVADVSFVFAMPSQGYDGRDPARRDPAGRNPAGRDVAGRDVVRQKQIVADAFAGAGWRTPSLIALMREAPDLYFDPISQITLDRYSHGRVALLGDAAWAAGPGGGGTGLALNGAYTLAGELVAAGGDHETAFARYERHMRPGVAAGQKQAKDAGSFLAPLTEKKLRQRNRAYRFLSKRLVAGLFVKLTERSANAMRIKEYA